MTDRDEVNLEKAFDSLRKAAPAPSPDFLARLAEDAEALRPSPAKNAAPKAPRRAWWLPVLASGGFAFASAVGVTLGLSMPETLNGLLLGDGDVLYLSEVLPAADPSLTLGE